MKSKAFIPKKKDKMELKISEARCKNVSKSEELGVPSTTDKLCGPKALDMSKPGRIRG